MCSAPWWSIQSWPGITTLLAALLLLIPHGNPQLQCGVSALGRVFSARKSKLLGNVSLKVSCALRVQLLARMRVNKSHDVAFPCYVANISHWSSTTQEIRIYAYLARHTCDRPREFASRTHPGGPMLLETIEALEFPKSALLYTLSYAAPKAAGVRKGMSFLICLKVRTICSMFHDLTNANALASRLAVFLLLGSTILVVATLLYLYPGRFPPNSSKAGSRISASSPMTIGYDPVIQTSSNFHTQK